MGCFFSCQTCGAPSVRFSDVKDSLGTGDIVLFSGVSVASAEVQCGTRSPFSHIGMVVRCEHVSGSGLYLWHSPAQELRYAPDKLTSRVKDGPQLNELRVCLRAANGKVFIRRLLRRGDAMSSPVIRLIGRTDPCENGLSELMRDEAPLPYETHFWELLKAAYDGPFGENAPDTSSLFCSELVAEAYKQLGLLNEGGEPSNEYVPSDFFGDAIQLINGYKLGELTHVVPT